MVSEENELILRRSSSGDSWAVKQRVAGPFDLVDQLSLFGEEPILQRLVNILSVFSVEVLLDHQLDVLVESLRLDLKHRVDAGLFKYPQTNFKVFELGLQFS